MLPGLKESREQAKQKSGDWRDVGVDRRRCCQKLRSHGTWRRQRVAAGSTTIRGEALEQPREEGKGEGQGAEAHAPSETKQAQPRATQLGAGYIRAFPGIPVATESHILEK